jgi:hypothetical protein
MKEWLMNGEGFESKQSYGLNRVLSWHLPGVTEESHRKPQVRTAGVPTKI